VDIGTKVPIGLTILDDESDPTRPSATRDSQVSLVVPYPAARSPLHGGGGIAEKNRPYLGVGFGVLAPHLQSSNISSRRSEIQRPGGTTFEVIDSLSPRRRMSPSSRRPPTGAKRLDGFWTEEAKSAE
jgi:hypothetical protein